MESEVDVIAPDGSPVLVYLRLPSRDEPEIIHNAIDGGSDILELGCGTGRITHGLIELGHRVTGVDESAEMLAHVRDAETVLGKIEELDLGRQFDCVVLASHLINDPDAHRREAFLETCRRHVSLEGCVLIERYDPAFDWEAQEGISRRLGDVTATLRDVTLDGDHLEAVMDYEIGDRLWRQPFEAVLLDEAELESALRSAGLKRERWLDGRRSWVDARAAF